jgi:hypothetical protein
VLKGGAWLLVMAWGVALAAAPRPKVSVGSFTVGRTAADEELGYFGPEVGRAVAAALEAGGVDVGSGGELSVNGRIEALDHDRIRLSAMARGHSVSVEGEVENLDQLASQLGARLAALFAEGEPLKGELPKKVGVRVPPPVVSREPAKKETPAVAMPSPEPKEAAKPPKPPQDDAPKPPKEEPPKPEPPKPEPPEKSDPYVGKTKGEMPDVLPAYPPSGYHPWGGFVGGRVVAHSIPDPPSSYVGTGVSATQALYGFLGRRLRLAVVPTGVGISSPQVAADEGWRSAARAVVMARIENLEYVPSSMGVSVRLRLQVVVVKEGRTVFRRVADSPLSDPTRRTDPVYQAVSGALESVVAELASILPSQ